MGDMSPAWLVPATGQIRADGDLGVVFRSYRQASGLSQQQLAGILGYDRTYITMIESGRRRITDRGTLARIARALAIPPHVLGIADPDGADFASVLALGASVIRLATIARHNGQAATAAGELWPLIASLESRVAGGHTEPAAMSLLAEAQVSFGVTLGHLLPEERMAAAARWTGRALRIATHLGDMQLLAFVLRMHGNELRKAGHPAAAVARLQQALRIDGDPVRGNDALVLLARAAAAAGRAALFDEVTGQCLRALDIAAGQDALLSAFTVREVRLRGLLATDRLAAAVALAAHDPTDIAPPSPQWHVIERITSADVLSQTGDKSAANDMLSGAVSDAETLRLPHQVQRVIRMTCRPGVLADPAVSEQARSALSRLSTQLASAVGVN
jgi:transcriptional regulator with XRE-family HTH domain